MTPPDAALTALEPCPFCGGPAACEGSDDDWATFCNDAECPAGPVVHAETREESIAAWNRRALRPDQQDGTITGPRVEWPEEPSDTVIDAACRLVLDRIKRRMVNDDDAPGIVEGMRETYRAMRAVHVAALPVAEKGDE